MQPARHPKGCRLACTKQELSKEILADENE